MTVVFDTSAGVKTVSKIKEHLMRAFKSGECICDLSAMPRIDCSIAQLLISAMKEGRQKGIRVKVKGLSDEAKLLFEMCGIKTGTKKV